MPIEPKKNKEDDGSSIASPRAGNVGRITENVPRMIQPRAEPLISREDRTARLAAAFGAHPLTVLVAPSGYGKTALLTLALADYGKPVARYTAELWQSDDFIAPLVEEVRRVRPDFGRVTLALARRPTEGDPAELERWAHRVGNSFAAELDHVRQPLAIAIEDVHTLADDAAFAAFMTSAVRALPEDVRIVLAGRTIPALPLAEWIANRRAVLFDVDHFRFSSQEVRDLAALLGREISAAEAERLCATYEGWAAGLALAFTVGDRAIPTVEGSLPARSAYLLEANIATLDRDLAAFLEATCVFQTMDAAVLERAEELGDVRRYLRDLERHGVMLHVVRAGEAYRLHPLLREALATRVRLRSGERALRSAHARAAGLLAAAGRTLEALYHFEAAEDDARLSRFVRERAYELFLAGQGERLGRIVRKLERNGAAPITAALIEGMLLRQRGQSGAEPAFARGIEEARAHGDAAAELTLRLLTTEDRLARREPIDARLFDDVISLGGRRLELAEANVYLFTGWSFAIEGAFQAARERARAALAIVGEHVIGSTRIASLDAYVSTCLGDFDAADRRMLETLRNLEASDHVVLLANTLVWYARFELLWGDAAAARDYAERGAALARDLELAAELAGAELALAQIYAISGERERCDATAEAARRSAANAWYAIDRERTKSMTAAFQARAAFAAKDLAAAIAIARDALASDMPPAQRAALASDLFAYLRLAGKTDPRFALAPVARLVAESPATDAVDAAALSTATDVLAAARRNDANVTIALHPHVGATFGAYLRRRREREAAAPASHDALVRALGPERVEAPQPRRQSGTSQLTKREDEILQLLAQGLSNREIAQRFTLSPRTVDTHVERVLSKLEATSRTRAVATALRLGLVK
jgi:LuxR family maltose regulon positive regulatory protein